MSNRSRTVERKKERQREERRQRQIISIVGVVALAVVIVLLLIVANQPAEAPIPEYTQTRYEGLATSVSEQGFPRLGNPDAPVQVAEFSSFACPACKSFHDTTLAALIDRVRTGDILLTYVPMYSTGNLQNGEGAARAAVCAGEQGAFWQFHDALFEWHGLYANQAFSQARINGGATTLGLDVGALNSCITSDRSGTIVRAAEGSAQALTGFTGTPTITVNGAIVAPDITSINAAIDQALALANSNPTPGPEATAESTAESTASAESTAEGTAEATAEATTAP